MGAGRAASGRLGPQGPGGPGAMAPGRPGVAAAGRAAEGRGPPSHAPDAKADALFERLRALRRELAAARRVPAYLVFHDAVLRDIAAARPATLEELAAVPGLGPRKLADFGLAVLAVVGAPPDAAARRTAAVPAAIRARDG